MKCNLLLCAVVLMAAGCASEQNPYATYGNNSFTYDMVPEPLPDLTPLQMEQIEHAPEVATAASSDVSR